LSTLFLFDEGGFGFYGSTISGVIGDPITYKQLMFMSNGGVLSMTGDISARQISLSAGYGVNLGSDWQVGNVNGDRFYIFNNGLGLDNIVIKPLTGFVGIKTPSPSHTFTVAGDIAINNAVNSLFTSNISSWSGNLNINLGGSGNALIIGGGRVGVGISGPNALMHLFTTSNEIMFRAEVTNADYPSTMFYGTAPATGTTYDFIGMYAGGVPRFNVNALGNVIAGGSITTKALAGGGVRSVSVDNNGLLVAGSAGGVKRYRATLIQGSTQNPTATVIENSGGGFSSWESYVFCTNWI
jgi:hypothetical protein